MSHIPKLRFIRARCPFFRLPTRNVYYSGTQVQWQWWRIVLVWG